MDVKVITQLSGSDSVHDFPALPASTTVGEVKAKLTEALDAHPTPDHQRLIYRGFLLARDGQTLAEAFGKDAAQPHVLHLVVRDAAPHRHSDARPASNVASAPPQPRAAGVAAAPPNGQPPAAPRQFPFGAPAIAQAIPHPSVHPQTPFDPTRLRAGLPTNPPATFHQPDMGFAQNPNPFPMPGLPGNAPLLPGSMFMRDGRMQMIQPGQPGANAAGRLSHQGSPDRSNSTTNGQTPVPVSHILNPPAASRHGSPRRENGHQAGVQLPQPGDPGTNPQPHQQGMRFVTGPSGEILSVSYTSSGPAPFMHHPPQMMPFQHPMMQRPMPGMIPYTHPSMGPSTQEVHSTRAMPNWPNAPPLGMTREYYGPAHAIDSMQHYHDDLARLHERLRDSWSGTPLHTPQQSVASGFRQQVQGLIAVRNRAQQMLNDLLVPGRYPYHNGLSARDVSLLQAMNHAFAALVDTVRRDIERIEAPAAAQAPNGGPAGNGTPSNALRSSQPTSRSATPSSTSSRTQQVPATAYLLSSPNGPQAIVFNSQGIYSSPEPGRTSGLQPSQMQDPVIDQLRSIASNPRLQRTPQERIDDRVARAREAVSSLNRELASANEALTAANAAVTNMQSTNNARARSARREGAREGEAAAPAVEAPQQVQVQAPVVDERNDVGNAVFQIFWHMWTIVKISAFIWLFTRGMSMRRTVMLVVAGILYAAAQAGLFGDYWDRLRGHFEGLLGLPHVDDVAPGGQAENAGQQQQQGDRAAGAAGAADAPQAQRRALPDPQAVADRLMQQRRDQDRNWLSERLLPVERALALFVASLYPGVGERHIQARERQLAERRRVEEETARAAAEAEASRGQGGNASEQSVRIESHGDGQAGSSSAVQTAEGTEALRERTVADGSTA